MQGGLKKSKFYNAGFASLLWRNASFVVPPVAFPHWTGSIPFNVICQEKLILL